jgi:hypothetical protein
MSDNYWSTTITQLAYIVADSFSVRFRIEYCNDLLYTSIETYGMKKFHRLQILLSRDSVKNSIPMRTTDVSTKQVFIHVVDLNN